MRSLRLAFGLAALVAVAAHAQAPAQPESQSFKIVEVADGVYAGIGLNGVFGNGAGAGGFGFEGGLGDIFDAFFGGAMRGASPGGPVRGADAELVLELNFREAVFGSRHDVALDGLVSCATCAGSGARAGTTAVRCPDCQGTGELRRVRQSILGQVVTAAPCRTRDWPTSTARPSAPSAPPWPR